MSILKITDFIYKPTSRYLENTSTYETTDFWIGTKDYTTNELIFVIPKKYLEYLNSRFAKIQTAKLYLMIDKNNLINNFNEIGFTYNFLKTKTICEFRDGFLIVDVSMIFKNIRERHFSNDNDKEFNLYIHDLNTNTIVFDKNKSYMEIDYTPIGNTTSNRPLLQHRFGFIDLTEGNNNVRIFDIGCQALSIYHLYNSKRSINENYHCGKKWCLSVNQKLLKDNQYSPKFYSNLYLYQDGTGAIEELVEKFYIDYNEEKIYVDKKEVKILDNGILEYTYKGKPYIVNVEHISKKGLKLQTDITEYKKDVSLELRDEEIAHLEEQIESLKKQKEEIEQSLMLMEKNKKLEKLSQEIRTLENLLTDQELPSDMNNNKYNQYKSIKDQISNIEKQYNSYLNDCHKEYYNIIQPMYLDNQTDDYLDQELEIHTDFLMDYKETKNDENYNWVNYEKTLNEINVTNYVTALRKKLNAIMSNISEQYYTFSNQLNEENYTNQKNSYQRNLDEINKNLTICEEKLEKLYRMNPVNYLISEQKEMYCFNKYGDLVNIVDCTGKKLSIEYFYDKIYRILSDDEECLTFKYKNDVLVELKNNKGDKTTFIYDENDNIIQVKKNDVVTHFYYDKNHLLTEILDDKCTGYQFDYNDNLQIYQVSEMTYATKIAENTFYKDEAFIVKNISRVVYDSLNKVTLYQGIQGKSEINLATSYIYDDDNNIKYMESEYYDYGENKKVKQRIAYNSVEKDYNIEVRMKDKKPNLLKESDFSHFTKNGEYYVLSGNDSIHSVANIKISKERLENYSYLVLSIDAIAESYCVKNERKSYTTSGKTDIDVNEPKFEIQFTTVYTNGKMDVQSQSFDWNIVDEQYLFFPVLIHPKYNKQYHDLPTTLPILLDTAYDIKEYIISIDYRNNNEYLLFKNLCLQEGEFEYQKLNDENLVVFECDETNLYEKYNEYDGKQLIKETIIKNGKQFDTTYHYDKDGNLLDTIDNLGIITEYTYNNQGINTITATYHKDNPIFKFYQEKEIDKGNVIVEKDETGQYITKYEYDKNNTNVTKMTQPNSAIMHYYQTPDCRVVSQSMVIDEQSNTNTKFYTKGLLTKLVNSKLKYNFEYDGFGRKTKVIINDSPYFEILYDDKNRTKTIKYASNQGLKYTTNINDELVQVEYIDKNNQFHSYLMQEYNEDGKVIKKQEFDNDLCYNEITYSYDDSDNLTCMVCDNYQVEYTYDNLNRLKKETIEIENEIESYQYLYDDEDNIKEIILPNSKIQMKTNDIYGRVKEIVYDNLEIDYIYKHVEDHLTNYVKDYKITTPNQLINYTYTYDEMGNIKKVEENEEVLSYEYDKASRLVKENNKKLNFTKIYTYDEMGNIQSVKEYEYQDETVLRTTTTNTYDNFGRLIQHNDSVIEYDLNHNPTVYEDKTIQFDKVKNLIQYNATTYTYDTNGSRREKITNGVTTTYITINNKIIEEKNINYHIQYYYGINGIVGFQYNGEEYTYIKDLTGNVIGILDEEGNIVAKYIYDGWGNHKVIDNTNQENKEENFIGNINPFRYKGYYYDVETQLFYCNSRYYSPELCRWISPDSIEYLDPESVNGLNLYCYCYNNPISYSDPSGNLPQWAEWLIGGALVVGAIALTIATAGVGGALATALGGSLLATIGSGIVVGAAVGAVSGMMINAGTQLITNGTENFSWAEFGKSAWTGAIAGGIAGGLFAGIQYGLSAGKIANSVSGLSKAQARLNNVFKPLGNVKNLANAPFRGANIAKTIGNVAANYNSAYSAYILAKGTNAIVNVGMSVAYFLFENLTSYLIGLAF